MKDKRDETIAVISKAIAKGDTRLEMIFLEVFLKAQKEHTCWSDIPAENFIVKAIVETKIGRKTIKEIINNYKKELK